MKRIISKIVRCPDCGKEGNPVKLKNGFSIYLANIKFVWYHCKRCDKKFTVKELIEKKKR